MSYATVDQLAIQLTSDGVTVLPSSEVLQALLDRASADVDTFCRRDFLLHNNDTLLLRGKGQDFLLLPGYPITAVTSLVVNGVEKAVQDIPVPPPPGDEPQNPPPLPLPPSVPGLILWPFGKISGVFFPMGATVALTYSWGYTEPPSAVVQATLRLASRIHRHGKVRDRVNEGVRSESIEGYSISFDPLEMDRDVANLLKDLRKRRAAA